MDGVVACLAASAHFLHLVLPHLPPQPQPAFLELDMILFLDGDDIVSVPQAEQTRLVESCAGDANTARVFALHSFC